MTNSKAKGGQFEREVCKKLSLWLSEGENDSVFWRSAMSGGRATVGAKDDNLRKTQSGDISSIHSMGEQFLNTFYVECKFYADLGLEAFFLTNKGTLGKFWQETVKEALKYNKEPMLVAKMNRRPTLVMIPFTCVLDFLAEPYDTVLELELGKDEVISEVFPLVKTIFIADTKEYMDVAIGFFEPLLAYSDPVFWLPLDSYAMEA